MVRVKIGERVLRKEDRRFLTGRGQYVDDIQLPRQTYARFLRSDLAHAKIRSIDTDIAETVPGVLAVLTGADCIAEGLGPLPCGWMIHSRDGSEMNTPAHHALAVDRVRYVGEPYAVVVGETPEAAHQGASAIVAEFEELPAVTTAKAALAEGAPELHETAPGNNCYSWGLGDKQAVDQAFSEAAHVTRLRIRNNRVAPNAIEPRAVIGDYDTGSGKFTLHVNSQNPHLCRLILAAFVQIAPEHNIRVISPDVGGGFGSKIFVYSEEVICLLAAKRIGRPVRWSASRSEAFLSDAHGRDHHTEVELALDNEGTFLALRVMTQANMGAYLSTFASAVPTWLYGTLLAGQYRTPAIYVEVDAAFTNTAPVDAYRGAGRPEACYVIERIVEKAARQLNLDPAAIRRRNFVPVDAFPYETPVALTYDTGDYEAHLGRALELSGYADFEERKVEASRRGKLRGIGLSCYIEACGLAPSQIAGSLGAGVGLFESAQLRVNATGGVTVFTGTKNHGQGHETTFAQLVADRLGLELEEVDVVSGDTDKVQYGLGTFGSRSLPVGGSAIWRALDKIVEKGRRIAAHMMETEAESVDFDEGLYSKKGTNKSVHFKEVAFAAYVPHNYPLKELEPGLHEIAYYDPENFTYPAGSYVCEVEIDPDTGSCEIIAFTAVDDFGRVVNPMIVEGQVHGGIAQGLGQALLEEAHYDPATGQLLTGSFMSYAMPRADDLPNYTLETTETFCTHNPLGVKGCGEAGAIGSPPALINAITDALGVDDVPMPATSQTIWNVLQQKNG